MSKISTIGLDLAKDVFLVHGADGVGIGPPQSVFRYSTSARFSASGKSVP